MKYGLFLTTAWCIAVSMHQAETNAQQVAPPLTADQKAAATTITQGNVLGTVSFLSSDEMAGRDTPSRELTIASAYVAARFRGAGLAPLGDDETYFQTYQYQTTRPSETPATVISPDGQTVAVLGVLSGGPADIDTNAELLTEKEALNAEAPEIVLIDELQLPPGTIARPNSIPGVLARRTRQLVGKGVKVVLVKCSLQSELREVSLALAEAPLRYREQLQPKCQILLVPEDSVVVNSKLTVRAEAQQIIDNPVRNVVAVLKGSDESLAEEAILISAHLDHIGTLSRGADTINNGADDNASGVTAVVSLADAFSSLNIAPKRSVIFVTFWGEEDGLLGSKEFVRNSPWPLQNITANINIEMIGRPEENAHEKMWMTGWKHSNLGEVLNAGASRVGVEVFHREDVSEMLYTRSDNYAFVKQDVIAHSVSAGSLHHDYHQPTDEWSKLNISHMTRVIQGIFSGALFVANGDVAIEKR